MLHSVSASIFLPNDYMSSFICNQGIYVTQGTKHWVTKFIPLVALFSLKLKVSIIT